MSEEHQNDEVKKECNCDESCDCGCQEGEACTCNDEQCGCQEDYYQKYDKKIEKLLTITAISSLITAICVIILTLTSAIGGFAGNSNIDNMIMQQQVKPLFNKESITLEEAMNDTKPIAVLFYADWCPHCQHFAPVFKKLTKDRNLKKTYNFVRINAENPEAQAKMEEFKVEGFPSLYLVNPTTGAKKHITNDKFVGNDVKEILVDILKDFIDDAE